LSVLGQAIIHVILSSFGRKLPPAERVSGFALEKREHFHRRKGANVSFLRKEERHGSLHSAKIYYIKGVFWQDKSLPAG